MYKRLNEQIVTGSTQFPFVVCMCIKDFFNVSGARRLLCNNRKIHAQLGSLVIFYII